MESNKGEAEKCKEIGIKSLRAGDFIKAHKFFDKSLRLYPLPGVAAMKERATESQTRKTAQPTRSTSAAHASASRHPASSSSSRGSTTAAPATPTRAHTPAQAAIVKHIRSCSTHYQVLGISKDATDVMIKKAYRKMALQLHPDKNAAPGAEDAFKAVGKAFSTLSDGDKRAHYDRYGDDDPNNGGGSSDGSRHTRQRHAAEMSPEDLFNMFFGGGMHSNNVHRRRTANPTASRATGGEAVRSPNPFHQLLQFLPLILFFIVAMLGGEEEVPFRLQHTVQFSQHRATSTGGVHRGIPYFVDRDFAARFTRQLSKLEKVEKQVERKYMHGLQNGCERQRSQQRQQMRKAQFQKTAALQQIAMEEAKQYYMPSCDKLRAMQYGSS